MKLGTINYNKLSMYAPCRGESRQGGYERHDKVTVVDKFFKFTFFDGKKRLIVCNTFGG